MTYSAVISNSYSKLIHVVKTIPLCYSGLRYNLFGLYSQRCEGSRICSVIRVSGTCYQLQSITDLRSSSFCGGLLHFGGWGLLILQCHLMPPFNYTFVIIQGLKC